MSSKRLTIEKKYFSFHGGESREPFYDQLLNTLEKNNEEKIFLDIETLFELDNTAILNEGQLTISTDENNKIVGIEGKDTRHRNFIAVSVFSFSKVDFFLVDINGKNIIKKITSDIPEILNNSKIYRTLFIEKRECEKLRKNLLKFIYNSLLILIENTNISEKEIFRIVILSSSNIKNILCDFYERSISVTNRNISDFLYLDKNNMKNQLFFYNNFNDIHSYSMRNINYLSSKYDEFIYIDIKFGGIISIKHQNRTLINKVVSDEDIGFSKVNSTTSSIYESIHDFDNNTGCCKYSLKEGLLKYYPDAIWNKLLFDKKKNLILNNGDIVDKNVVTLKISNSDIKVIDISQNDIYEIINQKAILQASLKCLLEEFKLNKNIKNIFIEGKEFLELLKIFVENILVYDYINTINFSDILSGFSNKENIDQFNYEYIDMITSVNFMKYLSNFKVLSN